ncbi:glutaredoxin-1 [Radiomyces spectabilis]|uniref:glutaredoxin-1 n=1 Tax=Radiomyces spectabilis TaxID=64574 RepID=UPI00221F0062|nr:glutaredoxin-1 [Radiomyces spectabilis]KAI8364664.1 glutaredoxin-1 [Radiomyces spectabilis]
MVAIEQLVKEAINNNKVAVFSKSYCPYCSKAKNVFKELGQEFYVIELDQDDKGSAIQQYLAQLTGQRTVPNIFINGEHIGGCDSLLAIKSSGKLVKLLNN